MRQGARSGLTEELQAPVSIVQRTRSVCPERRCANRFQIVEELESWVSRTPHSLLSRLRQTRANGLLFSFVPFALCDSLFYMFRALTLANAISCRHERLKTANMPGSMFAPIPLIGPKACLDSPRSSRR